MTRVSTVQLSVYVFTLCLYYRHVTSCISVVVISFSPQNYTVPEGTPANLMIVLDQASPKDITVTVTTMDITAQGTHVYLVSVDYDLHNISQSITT